MTTFGGREKQHHLWGTLAAMSGHVLAKTELFVEVDGAGVPTGVVYMGDGTTSPGIILARDASYPLLDGSRAFTGPLTLNAGLLASGTATFTGTVNVGAMQQFAVAPSWLSHNLTHTDAAGGRASAWHSSGEESDGTAHILVSMIDDHDGAGGDQKGRRRIYANSGADGMGNGQLLLTLTGADALALFEGEVRHSHAASASFIKTSAQSVAAAAGWTVVALTTTLHVDTGFTWSGAAAYELTCDFTGRVWISYHGTAKRDNATRGHVHWQVERDDGGGGGFVQVPGSLATNYVRTDTESGSAGVSRLPLDVTVDDKLRLVLDPSIDIQTVPHGIHFTVERGQAAV